VNVTRKRFTPVLGPPFATSRTSSSSVPPLHAVLNAPSFAISCLHPPDLFLQSPRRGLLRDLAEGCAGFGFGDQLVGRYHICGCDFYFSYCVFISK